MITSTTALLIIIILVALKLGAETWLSRLNCAEVRKHMNAAPAAASAIMDAETYQKSTAYTLAKAGFGSIERVWDSLVLVALFASGVLPWTHGCVTSALAGTFLAGTWAQVVYLLGVGIVLSVISLPFDWWGQFRLEARFGFNKSTPGLWVSDKIKGLAIALIIGAPLLWALLSLVHWMGAWWWVWGFALVFSFQILMLVLYPKVILPLFNKLTPLPEGGLRDRLMALSDRTGFKASTIQVMDGSKRSGHSNAFFTGFGRFRRIVLFDTLIEQLEPEELEAVLAHEVGHYKRGHIPKTLLTSSLMMLGGFALIAWLANSAWFNPAFGFATGDLAAAFLLFSLLSGLALFWITPVGNYFSRKHEYEADAFARDAMGGSSPLIGALRKLAQKNLSNLTPHPLYSRFYYSHPTIVERETAMNTPTKK
ncbi:STE24 endopeptidase [Ereboglobus sp. PH5-10]|uniref:M48 family metallopeptidase n=1 Tax=Ereboglobus sp. PH5-10 TaxID=2940629 RepID=UPI0024051CA3|nr:M48 family metallopeptidase [Ereboglobus sp. PH5-10]MDF9828128.1 STE24 endopeptidase [Ereboglobus sp. PH5-10]